MMAFAQGAAVVVLASTVLACGGRATSMYNSAAAASDAGSRSLIALEVRARSSGDTPSSIALVPPFAPGIHDYYVRCAAGANALTVSMTASPGAESLLLQPTQSSPAREQTLKVTVNENEAVVAAATDGTATEEYWVRCLPEDFPTMELVPHADAGAPMPGYYLVGNTTAPTGEGAYAIVLDGDGVPVWYDRAQNSVWNVDTVVPGAISFIDPSTTLSYEIHRLEPLRTNYLSVSGSPASEHELRFLSNGDYLVLLPVIKTGIDLTGLSITLPNGKIETFGPNGAIGDCTIQEIDPNGNVVWSWAASDHFNPVKDMTYLEPPGNVAGVGPVVEPYHCNSIDVDTNGNLLVSARHMDSVFYIEKSTGKVLWKMGGAAASKDKATYVSVADPFYRQHDARFQKSWASTCAGRSGGGQISLFDDETGLSNPARGVVYDVNVGASGCGETDDAAVGGATVAWQYKGAGPVGATGSFRVLPGGGGIIGWGTNAGFVFSEVDADGNDLVDFYFTDGSYSYRAVKVPRSAFDIGVMRRTASLDGPLRMDAGVIASPARDAEVDDVGADATAEDAETGGVGCSVLSGTGSTEQCNYSFSDAPGFDCSSLAGSTEGSCPSSALYGCCVESALADSGGQVVTATCYYSSVTAAASNCELEAYQGGGGEWQTSAP